MNRDCLGPRVSFPSIGVLERVGPPPPLALEDRTIHVWGFSLEGSDMMVDRFRVWLSPEEQARAARFIHRQDQTQFTLAHGGLRAVLARYIGSDPAVLRLHSGATGKPALLDQQNDPHVLRFNLSHSHGRMLLAVTRGQEVGIDLEQMRDKVEVLKLAERFYTPAEYQEVLSRDGVDRTRQFYRYWVAKEALLKGQGAGLLSFQQSEIGPSGSLGSAIANILPNGVLQTGWIIRWLDCGEGWQGALSASGSEWSVRVIEELPS